MKLKETDFQFWHSWRICINIRVTAFFSIQFPSICLCCFWNRKNRRNRSLINLYEESTVAVFNPCRISLSHHFIYLNFFLPMIREKASSWYEPMMNLLRKKALFSCVFLTDCLLPTRPGHCPGHFPRYSYRSGMCKVFIYGGCDGNANNYLDIDECKIACMSAS